ncbi:MAG: hypothetical protein ACLFUP_03105 [Desulfobacteraceae bacterium]
MGKTKLGKITLLLSFILLVGTAGGCAPGRIGFPAAEKEIRTEEPLLDPSEVERRIDRLEEALTKDLDEEREAELQRLLSDYRKTRSYLGRPGRSGDEKHVVKILYHALTRLEESYLEMSRAVRPSPPEITGALSDQKERILNAYVAGDHGAVLSGLDDLEAEYGPGYLDPALGVIKALSLAEQGKKAEALDLAEKILPELETRPGSAVLRGKMVSWYVETNRPDQARAQYEKLVDDLQETKVAINRAGRTLARLGIESRTDIEAMDEPKPPPGGKGQTELTGTEDLIKEVNRLISEGAFHEAKLLLVRHRIRSAGEEDRALIDRAMKRVEAAEAQAGEEDEPAIQQESATGEALTDARRLIEQEDYEGALASIEEMEQEEAPLAALRDLRREATEKLIHKEREEAAQLYLQARNAKDEKEKKALLASCYKILQGLLERFPGSDMTEKLERNLKTVREEMKSVGMSPPHP